MAFLEIVHAPTPRSSSLRQFTNPVKLCNRAVERLTELARHVEHLRALRGRVSGANALRRDLSLHNDVLFSLLATCQIVIDISGELTARKGLRFEDYTGAVRNLVVLDEFSDDLVRELSVLTGFRNVLIHEYETLDLERAVEALDRLEPVESFLEIVGRIEARRMMM